MTSQAQRQTMNWHIFESMKKATRIINKTSTTLNEIARVQLQPKHENIKTK